MSFILCRICGDSEKILKFIDDDLREKLRICLNITIDPEDDLPQCICGDCENGVEFSRKLREQGEATARRLRGEMLADETVNDEGVVPEDGSEHWDEDDIIVEMLEEDEQHDGRADEQDDDEEDYAIETLMEEYEEAHEAPADQVEQPTTKEPTTLNVQMVSMQIKAIYTCKTCSEVFQTQRAYQLHIKEHGNKRFQCDVCAKWFATPTRLRQHAVCRHQSGGPHQCPHCERVYGKHCNLLRHIRAKHERVRQYQCDQCGERFGRPDVLKTHLLTHDNHGEWACPQCDDRKFKSKHYLQTHMKTHKPPERNEKENVDAVPQKRPDRVTKRTPHKTYHCHLCGKISKHNFTHRNHLLTHTDQRPHACATCGKSFRTAAALITHQRIHADFRPYVCSVCGRGFRQPSHLKEHMRIHSGEMPFKCSLCEMAFVKKSNLSVHMRVHTNEKPYKCDRCMERFGRKLFLERHKRKVHGSVSVDKEQLDGEAPAGEEDGEGESYNGCNDEAAFLEEPVAVGAAGIAAPKDLNDADDNLDDFIEVVNDLHDYGQLYF